MVHFVGAGSGAVDLITVRGARLLGEADVVIYSGSLINPEVLRYVRQDCQLHDCAKLTLAQVVEIIRGAEAAGKATVRLHTGDVSLYGASREQFDRLHALGIPYDVCPGVSAFSGAAASLRTEYTLPGVSQTVIISRVAGRTPALERESIRSLAAHGATLILFTSAMVADVLQADLLAGGYSPDTPAALACRATWPDEALYRCTVGTLAETVQKNGLTGTALFIAGECLAGTEAGEA